MLLQSWAQILHSIIVPLVAGQASPRSALKTALESSLKLGFVIAYRLNWPSSVSILGTLLTAPILYQNLFSNCKMRFTVRLLLKLSSGPCESRITGLFERSEPPMASWELSFSSVPPASLEEARNGMASPEGVNDTCLSRAADFCSIWLIQVRIRTHSIEKQNFSFPFTCFTRVGTFKSRAQVLI